MNAGHEIAMSLRVAYWAMHRQADSLLQPLGVTANQFVLLSLLAEDDAATQRELVERASSDANTVRAMLVALEEKGLIARKRHPTDGRAWCVTLSPKGRRAYKTFWDVSDTLRDRLTTILRPDEADTLLDLLNRVSEAMAQKQVAPATLRDLPTCEQTAHESRTKTLKHSKPGIASGEPLVEK